MGQVRRRTGSSYRGILSSISCLQLYAGLVTLAFVLFLSEEQINLLRSLDYYVSHSTDHSHPPSILNIGSGSGGSSSSSNSSNSSTSSSGNLKPVNCRSFVTDVTTDTDPRGNEKVLVRTNSTQPFLMALHKEEHDKVRWDIVTYGRYYEWGLEDAWASILSQAADGSRVVDVGANVGYYSLFSASLGNFAIDSFEPNPANILRFCESVGVNFWGAPHHQEGDLAAASSSSSSSSFSSPGARRPTIDIWEIGVSSQEGHLSFSFDDTNPGAGRFVDSKEAQAQTKVRTIPVTTLDSFAMDRGWLANKDPIEILKVDVERHEADVLLGAKELLKSGLVKNIFAEVGAMERVVDRQRQVDALNVIIHAGYRLNGQGGFRGPTIPSPWEHGERLAESIVDHANSGNHAYINLWWTLGSH